MSGTHPSDEVLQEFVWDPTACTAEAIDHIAGCPGCQEAVGAYRVLAAALKKQPAPAFEFDLAASVIARIEAPPLKRRKEGSLLTTVLIVLIVGVPAWLFRKSAYFVFTDMSAVFYGVLLATAAIVVGLFLLRLHRKYQAVINLINK
ncbi:MAG TPA: hypothetical protein VFE32_16940 [Puia sp.]|jgi:hypothetical protein|nr:hypothetical protein [Puia sp.]